MVDITLRINGATCTGSPEARKTLADFLRDDLNLTGTHVGCEHGVCGACTVIVDGRAVRSCLMLAVQAAGSEVTTIEGLAPDGGLGPLQQAMWDSHSFQCGFCTPGFVMQATAFLSDHPDAGEQRIREALGHPPRHRLPRRAQRLVRRVGRAGRQPPGARRDRADPDRPVRGRRAAPPGQPRAAARGVPLVGHPPGYPHRDRPAGGKLLCRRSGAGGQAGRAAVRPGGPDPSSRCSWTASPPGPRPRSSPAGTCTAPSPRPPRPRRPATGVDYLGLVAAAHEEAAGTGAKIDFTQLGRLTAGEPGQDREPGQEEQR